MLLEKNSLAIVDLDGKETRTSLDIPAGNWARLSLAPADSGELELFCLYPTGTVTSIITALVLKGNSYTAWYHAGLEGDYELWYTILGSKSNSVKFLVKESHERPAGPVGAPGSGASVFYNAMAMAKSIAPLQLVPPAPASAFPLEAPRTSTTSGRISNRIIFLCQPMSPMRACFMTTTLIPARPRSARSSSARPTVTPSL